MRCAVCSATPKTADLKSPQSFRLLTVAAPPSLCRVFPFIPLAKGLYHTKIGLSLMAPGLQGSYPYRVAASVFR